MAGIFEDPCSCSADIIITVVLEDESTPVDIASFQANMNAALSVAGFFALASGSIEAATTVHTPHGMAMPPGGMGMVTTHTVHVGTGHGGAPPTPHGMNAPGTVHAPMGMAPKPTGMGGMGMGILKQNKQAGGSYIISVTTTFIEDQCPTQSEIDQIVSEFTPEFFQSVIGSGAGTVSSVIVVDDTLFCTPTACPQILSDISTICPTGDSACVDVSAAILCDVFTASQGPQDSPPPDKKLQKQCDFDLSTPSGRRTYATQACDVTFQQPTCSSPNDNLVTNGDFESVGDESWDINDPAGDTLITESPFGSAALILSSESLQTSRVSQTVFVQNGLTYELSFDYFVALTPTFACLKPIIGCSVHEFTVYIDETPCFHGTDNILKTTPSLSSGTCTFTPSTNIVVVTFIGERSNIFKFDEESKSSNDLEDLEDDKAVDTDTDPEDPFTGFFNVVDNVTISCVADA